MLGKMISDYLELRVKKTLDTEFISSELADSVTKDLTIVMQREQLEWEQELKQKLSTPIPKSYLHKKRPQIRLFPYMNDSSNGMVTKVGGKVSYRVESAKHAVITWESEIDSDHAFYTNFGIAGRKKAGSSTGAWVGWAEKVFQSKTYGGMKSVKTRLSDVLRNTSLIEIMIAKSLKRGSK